ncbi:MAG: helix-turn-helix transcriptional regulator [Lunatimonas sp.]|uniref:helix-turn-helix domain-containing protein n=1 Tax=Lunatimonas sp. TaxID=2060141 RepID=UPI00263ADA49|nr:helix-turn-helix transcriptional regulator [Lunatimonas sp.]MCC5937859.1 helix-turn-helix transcriptional regulator [Lunatimonas sp.]
MISLVSPARAQQILTTIVREKRLAQNLTQEGLADRSGVPVATLRKFEQKGSISLESFLKLMWVLGGLEDMLTALKASKTNFNSIEEVLAKNSEKPRKRGSKK